MQITFDLQDLGDPPFMAQKMYRYYQYDCLNAASLALRRCLEPNILGQIFSGLTNEEADKISKIIRVEIIVRFCQSAENLAALSISFTRSYPDEKQETLGLYKRFVRYRLGEIGDFYGNIADRNLTYFAKIAGYPSIDIQVDATKKAFLISCENIKEKFIEISKYYRELRLLYNAYKHGYRIFFETDNLTHKDVINYVTDDFKQKFTVMDTNITNRITGLSSSCMEIMQLFLKQHHRRVDHEAKGGGREIIDYELYVKKGQTDDSMRGLTLWYPTRGKRLSYEKKEGDQILDELLDSLSVKDRGKIVAIDIDAREIIAKDYDRSKVMDQIEKSNHTGRIHIRRISNDGRIHVDIY